MDDARLGVASSFDTLPDPPTIADKTEGAKDSEATNPLCRAQVFHGASSNCYCEDCLEDVKKEAEERLDNNSLAVGYIKKLEALGIQLQMQWDEDDEYSHVYHNGRILRRSSAESLQARVGSNNLTDPAACSSHDDASKAPIIADNAENNEGPKVDIRRMKKTINHYGDARVERDRAALKAVPSVNLSNEYMLSVYREYDRKKKYWRRTVEIRSPPFIQLLRQVVYSDVDLPAPDDMLRLKEPLMPLFHHRAKLAARTCNAHPDDDVAMQAREHTNLLLKFMEEECQDVVKIQEQLKEVGNISSTIEYEYVWLLYAPGSIVLSKENGEYEAFVIESIRGCQRHQPSFNSRYSHSSLELTCWSIDYDGEIFGRVWSAHYIAPFEGSKSISDLDLVPLAFQPERDMICKSLIERGQQFWALRGQCFREYTGEVWSSHAENAEPLRVMVDHLTYQRRMDWPIEIDRKRGPANAQSKNWRENRFSRGRTGGPPQAPYDWTTPTHPRRRHGVNRIIKAHGDDRDVSPDRWNPGQDQPEERYERVDCDRPPQAANAPYKKYDAMKPETDPDELTRLVSPQTVHGYSLRDKVWKNLNVTQLRPVNFRKNAWERLVLDEEYKEIVQAMVSSYVDKTAGLEDIIAGKGAGLVTLLHGPPGTGKTLTAECVAEAFSKPLLHITCGEIGTNAPMLEERLTEVFDDAVTWGAILVLDEADVFLQERDYENLERNALVSIFLRTLEYFNGVLFLTTNRVGTFDQAFQSRIHITLGLPTLDQPRRTDVWMLFLEELAKSQRLSSGQLDELQDQVIQTWSRQSLNGRQIRNSVRTALLVAEKKKEIVSRKHFETVLRIGKEFENFMFVLKKGEADELSG
ncbi:MAG: hypothetical protein Q9181_007817 [Wetmoreana brouardii]